MALQLSEHPGRLRLLSYPGAYIYPDCPLPFQGVEVFFLWPHLYLSFVLIALTAC